MNTKIYEVTKKYEELINKYPLVSKDFIVKSEKLQNIENNQEIHEINKRLDKIEELLKGK